MQQYEQQNQQQQQTIVNLNGQISLLKQTITNNQQQFADEKQALENSLIVVKGNFYFIIKKIT